MPRVLVVHPGATWSTADVFDGLTHGLRHWGCEVIEYRLDGRMAHEFRATAALYRRSKQLHKDVPIKPDRIDTLYKASAEAVSVALIKKADAVIVISAMFFHPAAILMLRRANTKVVFMCTESPYDLEHELRLADLITKQDDYAGQLVNPLSGVWTNERSSVAAFQSVNPRSGYLKHAWHPERHTPIPGALDATVAAHDVVFVGTGGAAFKERTEFFETIDWTGIDLGLYGTWDGLSARSPLRPYVRASEVTNVMAAALYRRAKINLNFYRKSKGAGPNASRLTTVAESLNPRAYELAACGAFHLSDPRAEVAETFGALVPTFTTAGEAEALIRQWLADDAGRAAVAAQLPARVAEDSWVHRARQVIGDLRSLLQPVDAPSAPTAAA
ncbi:MAG: glycosyltransferase [Vicinamibacterales bacterium]